MGLVVLQVHKVLKGQMEIQAKKVPKVVLALLEQQEMEEQQVPPVP